jgi:hypothetical protein
MEDSVLIDEVLELTLALQRGDASEEERARLERLLADNPQAIVWYLRIVQDTLTLREAAAAGETAATAARNEADLSPSLSEAPQGVLGAADRPALMRGARWWLSLASAVCLLLALAGVPWLWWSAHGSSADAGQGADGQSARVMNMSNVRWSDGAAQYAEWSFVAPGDKLQFDTGLVNLFLANGVELLIEGPADVQFVSLRRVVAKKGKLAARVGPSAIGFRIDTPHANVIDRGTAFGLSVDEDCRTSVVVYEGMVDLDVLGDRTHPRRRLATGEALSVDRKGQLSRITTVQSAEFLEPPQVGAAIGPQDRVITSVSDNIRSLETAKYYRVMPGGFREDCRAYVDRLHEWNGLDGRGLPPFLLGGDYVMTFNDDKVVTEIEIAVGINQPANLYVLIDDRVPPPEWLKRDFVDTHWDVGSDEGYDDHVIDNGFGTGQSIDHVCSVWRREVAEPTTVILGALSNEAFTMPAQDVERSMYGVVAMPLRQDSPDVARDQEPESR